jgi:KDO2-lipid IV(A) lauroyltransferase
MQFLVGLFIYFLSLLLGILPFFILYLFSDFLSFFLYRIIRYRRDVVEQNLRLCFPDKPVAEINRLTKAFYKNLSDVTIEGIKAFTMSRRQVLKRHSLVNTGFLDDAFKEGKSVIACVAHYTNWEWGSMSGGPQVDHNYIVMYKPLANKWVDRYVRRSRAKFGAKLASIFETARVFRDEVPKTSIFVLAADQSPSNLNKAIWIDFLGIETAFLHGPEFYARKYDLPVAFVDIQRVKRGYYELTFSWLTKEPKSLKSGEITQLYASRIEASIRKQPENWLWSHRRWKHRREFNV